MIDARSDTWFGQPKGLTVLFLTEMWEKFSFYGMRALLVYYMTKQLHFSQANSSLIYGAYAAGVYLTPIFGGMIADRWLGRRKAVIWGGLFMACGHFMMGFEPLFFPAMITIAIGNGLFLPNLPSQIPLLFADNDPRRVSAFNVYYVGVNLGGFLAPLICGTVGELYGWDYGFACAGIGMCLGLANYVLGIRHLPPDTPAARRQPIEINTEKKPNAIYLLLSVGLAVVLFRTSYEQTGNTLALWADTSVDRAFFGATIPVTWFQSLNSMFVFLISPILIAFWNQRARKGRAAPRLSRMAYGAFIVAISYWILAAVIHVDGFGAQATSWIWLVVFFAVLTVGELYILPVGLDLFASLAPAHFGATTIAAWFLASFAGNLLSGYVGTWWEFLKPDMFFIAMGGICALAAALLGLIMMFERGQLKNEM